MSWAVCPTTDPVLLVYNKQMRFNYCKALHKTEFSKHFVFASFGNVRLSKFGNFSEKKRNFWTRKIFAKKFGKKFRNLSSEKSLDINQNCTSISKILKNYVKFEFLSQKKLFLGKKVWKCLETGFSKHSEILEIFIFRTFRKLWKNDVKLELRKLWKTCSNSKTDSKVRLKFGMQGLKLLIKMLEFYLKRLTFFQTDKNGLLKAA